MLLHFYAKLARSAHVAQSVTDTHLLYFDMAECYLEGIVLFTQIPLMAV